MELSDLPRKPLFDIKNFFEKSHTGLGIGEGVYSIPELYEVLRLRRGVVEMWWRIIDKYRLFTFFLPRAVRDGSRNF